MHTAEQQLLIGFNEFKVTSLTLTLSGPNKIDELNVFLEFDPVFYSEPEKSKEFSLNFHIKVYNDDNSFLVDLTALTFFKVNHPIDEDFKKSDWVIVNAPAIAFPFLRAYLSTITLNSGIRPVVLPAFNFTRMNPEKLPSP